MSMSQRPQFVYLYDGTFPGFLTCVFESYARDEEPACFSGFDDPRTSLWPERAVETDREKAERVYRSLSRKVSPEVQKWVRHGFLTCVPEKERRLYDFIRLAYRAGPAVVRDLTDPRVAPLHTALLHLWKEAHLFQGFVRFSDQGGVLCGQITPKNRVLPLLRPHFCARFSRERLLLYDCTHQEALLYQPRQWAILPLEEFHLEGPGEEERDYRQLWRRFYDTIAIRERKNPRCRMTHMPKRYWDDMTEFQTEAAASGTALART